MQQPGPEWYMGHTLLIAPSTELIPARTHPPLGFSLICDTLIASFNYVFECTLLIPGILIRKLNVLCEFLIKSGILELVRDLVTQE